MDACKKSFDTFKKKIEELYLAFPKSPDLLALNLFYQQTPDMMIDAMKKDSLWSDMEKNLSKKYSTFSFMLEGDVRIIAEKQELLGLINEESASDKQVCLISGKNETIVETTTATMIPGSQATAKLVAFQVKSGYDSYGKEKGKNAPIGETSEFAYTTALNYMLSSDSRNKFMIGSRTYLFWASSNNEACSQAEDCIFNMFGFNPNEDDPNKQIEQVHKVFKSIYSGTLETSLDDKFDILGLAPNSARIAVVYWAEIQLKKFAGLISRHFDDMEIVDGRFERFPYMGLKSILGAVTLGGKSNEATPNLPDAVVKSIFQGLPYPYTLFAGCIRRIRAEQSIKITRAAIIKAYLNRLDNKEQKIKVMLDKENKNQGYLCGRLFAVLEKIQEEANNQHSIRERYMNSASATPAIVFPTILNLSSHHSEKLSEGRNVWFEKLKQEIVDKISSNGFPAHLDLQDQGRFFVGYYHQRQDFFEKKSNKNENE
jgi:CRISPR-associated protein Csd1